MCLHVIVCVCLCACVPVCVWVWSDVPQVSYIQTSVNDGDIEVRWKAPDQPVSGYMIDWTYDGLKYFWKEIKDTNTTLTGWLEERNVMMDGWMDV